MQGNGGGRRGAAKFLRHRERTHRVDTGQQDHEFITRIPSDVLARPQAVASEARDHAQRIITGEVTEVVVHGLELIDVDHQQRNGRSGAPPFCEYCGRDVHERATHEGAREVVVLRHRHLVRRAGFAQRRGALGR